jgi:hypothetical protein
VLHWDHSGAVTPTERIVDYDEVIVRLRGSNAVYNFRNEIVPNPVVYAPYQTDTTAAILAIDDIPDWLRIYYYPDDIFSRILSDSTVYDFKLLRLMVGNDVTLTVLRKKPAMEEVENLFAPAGSPMRSNPEYGVNIIGSGNEGFTQLFRESLSRTTPMMQQDVFDKYENYRIDVYFRFDEMANTYISAIIVKIEDWRKIEYPVVGGSS